MISLDALMSSSQRENQIQAGLLGVLLDGGRLVSTGEISESLLNMVPDLFSFEKRSLEETTALSKLSTRDLLFVEKASVDQLWNLAKITGAQIAYISDSDLQSDLVDFSLQEKDLRSAILGLRGLWSQLGDAEKKNFSFDGEQDQKALFLDRDGVLIEDTDFVKDAEQIKILPGVIDALKQARSKGYRLVVVTNQSGIGRGLITWQQYDAVTLKMLQYLAEGGVVIDRVVVAPFFNNSQIAGGLGRRSLRKPRPGLIHQVASELRLDLSKSALVGDKARDLISGALAGVPKLFLVKSNDTEAEHTRWKQWPLLSRVPLKNEMHIVSDWNQILAKI